MAKTVSKETTESAFGTEKDNMQGCYDAIDSCGKGFDKALTKMEGDLRTAQGGIAGWAADDVQVKLDDFLAEDMSPFLTAIKTDISGGSFLSLKNTAKQLITDLDNCKKAKKAWEDAKTTLSKTPKTIKERKANNTNWAPSYQGGQNPNTADYGFHEEEKANPDYATAEKAAKDAERTLENYCQTANNHFSELTQFTFKKPNPAGGSGATGTGGENQTPPANPDPPENPDTPLTTEPTGYQDVYTGDFMPRRSHLTMDESLGAFIIQDESHYATLYIDDGTGSMTVIELGDVSGCDSVIFFDKIREGDGDEGLKLIQAIEERQLGPLGSGSWLNGSREEAVHYEVPGQITFTTDASGNPVPQIVYPEGSQPYQSDYTMDANAVADACLAGGGEHMDHIPSYDDITNGTY